MPSSRSEEHTCELQSHLNLVCRLLLEKKKTSTRMQVRSLTSAHVCVRVYVSVRACSLRVQRRCAHVTLHMSAHVFFFFFFNDTATTEIYTLSLHDALPI